MASGDGSSGDSAEKRYERLRDAGVATVVVAELSGRLLEANDAFLAATGYTREELQAGELTWAGMTPEEWLPVSYAAAEEVRVHGVAQTFEKAYLRKDGGQVPVLISATRLHDGTVLTVGVDLSRTKREEEKRAAILHSSLDAIVAIEQTGEVFEWNPSAERMFGYARAEALGRFLPELIIPARLREEHLAGFREYLANGDGPLVGKRTELAVMRRDGSELPAELTLSRIGTGEPATFVGFIRDISVRKEGEAALLERARVAALAADIAAILTTGDSLPTLLQRCGEAVTTYLDDVRLVRIWTCSPPRPQLELQTSTGPAAPPGALHDAHLLPSLDVGTVAERRAAVVREDASGTFAGYPLVFDGQLLGVLALYARSPFSAVAQRTFESISGAIAVRLRAKLAERETAELEAQVRQMQKMEAVGRLAGGVAHDFNNVLSVVMVSSDVLLDELRPADPLREEVKAIHLACSRAADLTRQLLTFSRHQVVAPRVFDLDQVITEMQPMLRRLLGEDVELVARVDAKHARVRMDPGSIEQVIVNLAINARDAMTAGGQLIMETSSVVCDEEYARVHLGVAPGPYVCLQVRDTGSGMDEATMARIFEPFFTTKEKGRGTGLGLATVFGIIQRSGGHLSVASDNRSGSTFTVQLPRVDAELEAPEVKRPARLHGSETVLLVEDEDQVRAAAASILRRYGYTVLPASDPAEALVVFERNGPTIDLLLTDIVMPQMSGTALARRLLRARPTLKVLCVSGYTDDGSLGRGESNVVFSYLQKPFSAETLTRKVRETLDAGSPRDAAE